MTPRSVGFIWPLDSSRVMLTSGPCGQGTLVDILVSGGKFDNLPAM